MNRKAWTPVQVFHALVSSLRYLLVWPSDRDAVVRIALGLYASGISLLSSRGQFVTVGYYIPGRRIDTVNVNVQGIHAVIRPGTEDIGILAMIHEPRVLRWVTFHPGQLFVDVGAHIGTYTLRAAKAGARIVAFEADPSNFDILRTNVRLNRYEGVTLHHVAIGSEEGWIWMASNPIFTGRSRMSRETRIGIDKTRICRLDDVLDGVSFPKIDIMKIDVEGSELEVLQGGVEALRRTKQLVLEVENQQFEQVWAELTKIGGFREMGRDVQEAVTYLNMVRID